MEVATHPHIYSCSSAYEGLMETKYGCFQTTSIAQTDSGGCKEFQLLVEDCLAVSDKRGNRPMLEVFGQCLESVVTEKPWQLFNSSSNIILS